MSIQLFTAVILRVFAIGLGVFVFRYGTNTIPYMISIGFDESAYLSSLFLVGTALSAIAIWILALPLAKILLPIDTDQKLETKVTVDELLGTGIVLVGIYLLFYVISDTVYWIIVVNGSEYLELDTKARIVATGFEAAFVIVLLLGGRHIVNLIRRMRYGE